MGWHAASLPLATPLTTEEMGPGLETETEEEEGPGQNTRPPQPSQPSTNPHRTTILGNPGTQTLQNWFQASFAFMNVHVFFKVIIVNLFYFASMDECLISCVEAQKQVIPMHIHNLLLQSSFIKRGYPPVNFYDQHINAWKNTLNSYQIQRENWEIIWWKFVLQWSCARNIIVANIKRSRCYKNYTLFYFSLLLCTRAVKMAHSYKKFLWKAKYTWIPFIANLWFIISMQL